MNITDQTGTNWKEIVKAMDSDDFQSDPDAFLAKRNAKIDPTLHEHVERLRNVTVDEDSKKMWHALKALAEGQLSPEERRDIICKLAERYQGFVDWEGKAKDEPGW